MMKKLLVLLLTAVLLGCMTLAAGDMDATGIWYLNAVEVYGGTVSVADTGMAMTLTLNADGTAVNAMVGIEAVDEGTWTLNGSAGTVSFAYASFEFALTGDTLVLAPGENQRMIFTRDPSAGSLALDEGVSQGTIFVRDPSAPANAPIEVTVIKTSPVVAIEDASVVDGAWGMTLTSLLNVQELPDGHRIEELFCMDGCMVLADGKVSLDGDMVPMTLTDGVLTLADDRDGVQLTIKLLADGKLRVSYLGVEFESGRGK